MSPESKSQTTENTRRDFLKKLTPVAIGFTSKVVGVADGYMALQKQGELEKQGKTDNGLGFRLLGDLVLLLAGYALEEKGEYEMGMGYRRLMERWKTALDTADQYRPPDHTKGGVQNGSKGNPEHKEIK
jgi:hypothetical protein